MTTQIDLNELRNALVQIVDEALAPIAQRVASVEQMVASQAAALPRAADSASDVTGPAPAPIAESTDAPVTARDVKQDIIDAAVELFHERGYEGTGVQEIVERAGVTKGALYHYFRSKEDLLLYIRGDFMDHLVRRGQEILEGSESAAEAVRLIIYELLLLIKERRANLTVGFFETRLDFERYPKAKEQRDKWEGLLIGIIERGQRTKEFRPTVNSRRAAALIGNVAWAAYNWFPDETTTDLESMADDFAGIVLQGLARTPAGRKPS